MSDPLKNFIENNRDAFDSERPGSTIFRRIEEQLPDYSTKKKHNWWSYRRVAIMTGVLLASAVFYILLEKNKTGSQALDTGQPGSQTEEIITLDIGDPVYAKQIYYFRELIGLKQSELKQLQKEYPQLYQQFVGDINELDSSYQSLKIKLAANPNREMLLEAMIQNLQLQSELLNRQLTIIKEIKQKSKSYEKTI